MGFRWLAMVFLGALWLGIPASADSFATMSNKCGTTPESRKYSQAEYVKAAADGEKARKAATKAKDTRKATEIQLQMKKLKECEKEHMSSFDVPPYTDCPTFIADAKSYASWADAASKGNFATERYIERIKQRFKPLADQCLREVMKNCINPLDTKAVLDAVDAVETASRFTDVYTYGRETGIRRMVFTSPLYSQLTFCADTDFACTGPAALCASRVSRIKAAFQTFVE